MPFPISNRQSLLRTKVIEFYVAHELAPNVGISRPSYYDVDGYRYINIFVEFTQQTAGEKGIGLGVMFALDAAGKYGSRRYANLEENVEAPQIPAFIGVRGENCWHGAQHLKGSYNVRLPIMGPYMNVFPFNESVSQTKTFSIVGYLTT
jgi:hypothetical protein